VAGASAVVTVAMVVAVVSSVAVVMWGLAVAMATLDDLARTVTSMVVLG
jgi:hypothetical protein